jgi:transposase InsO family protein
LTGTPPNGADTALKQCAACNVALPVCVNEGGILANDLRCDAQSDRLIMQVACTRSSDADEGGAMFAKLKYLNVKLLGDDDHVLRATYDTGTEVSVIRESLLESRNISYLDVGNVQLRPMAGPSVPARLLRVRAKIVNELTDNDCEYSDIIVAACEGLHDEMILAGPVADDLIDKFNRGFVNGKGEVTYEAAQSDHASIDVIDNDLLHNVNDSQYENDVTVMVDAVTRRGTDTQPASDGADYNSLPVSSRADTTDGELADDTAIASSFLNVDNVENSSLLPSTGLQELIAEQQSDETLKRAFSLAHGNKGGYSLKDGVLYRNEIHCGQRVTNLVVPERRRLGVVKLAHNSAHWGRKKTYQRIIMSGLTFPDVSAMVADYVSKCATCQLRARQMKTDRVPISVVDRGEHVFRKFYCDVCGPFLPAQKLRYNHALVLVDSVSRYPFAYPLSSLHARNICDALMSMFEITGICSHMILVSDNASYFRASLTQELLKRLGVSPLFSTAYHPEGHAPAERLIQSLKTLISKLAYEQQNKWTSYLGLCLWCLRESPHSSTKVPPHLLVFGYLPRGPLAILRETWLGQREISDAKLTRSTSDYLEDLLHRLQMARNYALENDGKEQKRHVVNYNRRARDKSFVVGDRCLILQRDSTSSSLFSRWKGPAEIVEVVSPYTYMIEYNGGRYKLHANQLRKYNLRVDRVECSVIGNVLPLHDDHNVENNAELTLSCDNCAIIYDTDTDFGDIVLPEAFQADAGNLLPSQKIEPHKLAHLTADQRRELLAVLDKYPHVFSDTPGLCTAVQHEIPLVEGFVPRQFRAYRVPMHFKKEVDDHIAKLLNCVSSNRALALKFLR